jgi:cytochrome P450
VNVEPPRDPIAAVTHPDPYPYYADLVTRRPLYRDDALGLWVASSAGAVSPVLASELCRVRPPTEPVPKALVGSPAGEIFRHLVRMNDGPGHARLKPAVSATLTVFNPTRAVEETRRWAALLMEELGSERVSDFAFRLSVHVVGTLLGMPRDVLPRAAVWMSDFVRCLAPGSAPEQLERGNAAARQLLDLFTVMLTATDAHPDTLLSGLATQARRLGSDDDSVIVANGIGFLSQAYEATAGLIGNTLVTLVRHPDVRDLWQRHPGLRRQVLAEVLRYDPPVQNTRRFLEEDGIVAGTPMKAGDAILVVLAAANRDPAANPRPARFDASRMDRQVFTFGVGRHACPGEMLAVTIAEAGVEQLIAAGVDLPSLVETLAYRPSANTRIPVFGPPR